MFERFTERGRRVVVFAQDEARGLGHNYIGTEHLLLGLLREEEGVAARVLESLRVTLDAAREQVVRIIGRGEEVETGQMPFTPRAKKALEHALREAIALGHNHIGTEHVLLALLRDEEGVALRILVDFSATPELVREGVARELGVAPAELPRAAVRRPVLRRRRLDVSTAFVVGWLLFAASLGIGILIGWAIWG